MTSNISTTVITIDPSVVTLNIARIGIQRFGQLILFALDIIGCIFNIAIFLRPSMRTNSCANLCCLTWGLFISMLDFFMNYNLLNYSSAYCKIRSYSLTAAQLASRACVVLACFDRFLLCSQSVRQRSFCRSNIAVKVMLLTVTSCVCLSIYVLVVYNAFPQTRSCTTSSAIGKIIDTTVLFAFNLGTPALLMSTLSGLILWKLKQNSIRIARQRIHVRHRHLQLATMLIGQVILYTVTALPFVSTFVYMKITRYDPQSSKSAYRIAAESFGTFIFNALRIYFIFKLNIFDCVISDEFLCLYINSSKFSS
ncbi:unnamed protein product [Adineta ricciae]|uniref:G-protein coupled receptors family 1 profile domain-containing protein n=1 Tax=Adineta ricciae TaxID=249248 RepID=A0A815SX77_ADIRI|nr:unnamed protein product [Adineta ricciae]CAF1545951.1 unnamed protein product [Adineta ricciae]